MASNEKPRRGEDSVQVVSKEEIPRERWDGLYKLGGTGGDANGKPSLRQKMEELLLATEQRPPEK